MGTKNHEAGCEHPDFEEKTASFEAVQERTLLDAKTTNRANRGHVCRCLGPCGKLTLQRKPSNGLCPTCGSYCASASFASRTQARELAHKSWTVVDSDSIANAVRSLGLIPMAIGKDLESDLRRIARSRNDDFRRNHLFAHRHIIGRPGLANGDLKSKAALRKALSRGVTVPKFLRTPDRESPGVVGKLIEAELEFRADRRQVSAISMGSATVRYVHPILGPTFGPIAVEYDGCAGELPVELKTVSTFEALVRHPHKIREMMMQVAGQAIALNVDDGIILVAERDGSLLTAIRVGGLRQYHGRNMAQWLAELSWNHRLTEMTSREVITNVEL